jgi:galactose mutarotase-like enzyme
MKSRIMMFCSLVLAVAGFLVVPAKAQMTDAAPEDKPVVLTRAYTQLDRPHFVEADFLPEHGMNLFQLKAYLPGKGVVSLLASPSLEDAKVKLDGVDPYGNEAFKIGGAFLLPYANRIRGTLSADGKNIEAEANGEKLLVPANWKGDNPGAELHSMHGLILNAKFGDVKLLNGKELSTVSALLHAGNFGGRWPSQTDVKIEARLEDTVLDLKVTATNVGKERLPMAIGMHPYFAFPSGDRKQARVHMPATMRAPANNYDDVFTLGKLIPVKNTDFDFTAESGVPLKEAFFDESFTSLERNPKGAAEVRVTDPAAKYGIEVIALSKEIRTIQMYAPPKKNFVAIEPQYNLSDPFDKKVWGNQDTGVVYLKPGQSTTWHVQFALYELSEKP